MSCRQRGGGDRVALLLVELPLFIVYGVALHIGGYAYGFPEAVVSSVVGKKCPSSPFVNLAVDGKKSWGNLSIQKWGMMASAAGQSESGDWFPMHARSVGCVLPSASFPLLPWRAASHQDPSMFIKYYFRGSIFSRAASPMSVQDYTLSTPATLAPSSPTRPRQAHHALPRASRPPLAGLAGLANLSFLTVFSVAGTAISQVYNSFYQIDLGTPSSPPSSPARQSALSGRPFPRPPPLLSLSLSLSPLLMPLPPHARVLSAKKEVGGPCPRPTGRCCVTVLAGEGRYVMHPPGGASEGKPGMGGRGKAAAALARPRAPRCPSSRGAALLW